MTESEYAEYQLIKKQLAEGRLVELPATHTIIDKDELIDLQNYKIAALEGRSRVAFSEEEQRFMLGAKAEGMSNKRIAEAINRAQGSVNSFFHQLKNKQLQQGAPGGDTRSH